MNWEKVFVIGFNKTATSSFHRLFCDLGLRSQHSCSKWLVDSFDCFSDNGDLQDVEILKIKFPNSLFILNTRGLEKWIFSRARHCSPDELGNFRSWGWPPTSDLFVNWILDRNYYFNKILVLFRDCPERLVIVSVEKPFWQQFVANILGFDFEGQILDNIGKNISEEHEILIQKSLNKAFLEFGIEDSERNCEFLPSHPLMHNYKRNF
jgi:hypothetical protein